MRVGLLKILGLLASFTVAADTVAEAQPVSQRLQDGETIYRQVCADFHDRGEGGAPVMGKPEQWRGRSALWQAVLFEHAEKGYLAMPAGGGDSRLTQSATQPITRSSDTLG